MLGVEILDIDYFKKYNDHFGHPEGDRCLVAVAEVIAEVCREAERGEGSVFCGRYGGDEFIMIYENMDKTQILSQANALYQALLDKALPHPKNPPGKIVTVSQGICVGTPGQKQKVWDYLSAADVAMYQVKRARSSKRPKKYGISLRDIEVKKKGRA